MCSILRIPRRPRRRCHSPSSDPMALANNKRNVALPLGLVLPACHFIGLRLPRSPRDKCAEMMVRVDAGTALLRPVLLTIPRLPYVLPSRPALPRRTIAQRAARRATVRRMFLMFANGGVLSLGNSHIATTLFEVLRCLVPPHIGYVLRNANAKHSWRCEGRLELRCGMCFLVTVPHLSWREVGARCLRALDGVETISRTRLSTAQCPTNGAYQTLRVAWYVY